LFCSNPWPRFFFFRRGNFLILPPLTRSAPSPIPAKGRTLQFFSGGPVFFTLFFFFVVFFFVLVFGFSVFNLLGLQLPGKVGERRAKVRFQFKYPFLADRLYEPFLCVPFSPPRGLVIQAPLPFFFSPLSAFSSPPPQRLNRVKGGFFRIWTRSSPAFFPPPPHSCPL